MIFIIKVYDFSFELGIKFRASHVLGKHSTILNLEL